MSETQAWPSQSTVDELRSGIALLQSRIRLLENNVGKRVHDFRGDDFKPVRDLLVQIVGELEALDPAALSLLLSRVESEMVPRREPGLDTDAWLASVPGRLGRNQRLV